MYPVAQVSKPGIHALAVDLFNTRIIVGSSGHGPGDTDPVLVAAVLECDRSGGVLGEILEFLGLLIGDVEKVGT